MQWMVLALWEAESGSRRRVEAQLSPQLADWASERNFTFLSPVFSVYKSKDLD